MAKKIAVIGTESPAAVDATGLLAELRELIHYARQRVATAANAEQTLLYWRLGKRIANENLIEGRAEYGKRILATVSQKLVAEFGNGFSYSALTRMVRFAELFADEAIVVSLLQQLGWAHFLALLPIKNTLAASSTPRCADLSAGRFALCGRRSVACYMSGRLSQKIPKRSLKPN